AGGRRGGKLQIGRGSSSGVDEGEGEARLSAGHRLARQALLRADDGDLRFARYVEAELRGSGEPFAGNLEPGFIAPGCDPTRWDHLHRDRLDRAGGDGQAGDLFRAITLLEACLEAG